MSNTPRVLSTFRICSAVVVLLLAAAALLLPDRWGARSVDAQSGLGGPLPNITSLESSLFTGGQHIFTKLWDAAHGLGPVMTQNGCALCHSSPVAGGFSTRSITLF